jgi:hypothetical protein
MRVLKTEGKRLLEKPKRGWQANIKLDFKNGWEGVDWIQLAQDRDQ